MARITSVRAGDFDALALENDHVRVVIIPELGGRVWELTDRLRNRQWIWHRSGVSLSRVAPGSSYDDVWAGGWEELFPNDAAGRFEGRDLPDHGEWWTASWSVVPTHSDFPGIRLETLTSVRRTRCTKEVTLDGEAITVSYRIESLESEPFHCLFKQHLAIAVTPSCRLRLPGGTVTVVDPGFGTIVGAADSFQWPSCTGSGGKVADLGSVSAPSLDTREFVYVEDLRAGWCGVDDLERRASLRMAFDKAVLPFVWLFITYGGWRDCYTTVLEPCTNMPKDLDGAVRQGRSMELQPGQIFETRVAVTLRELEAAASTTS